MISSFLIIKTANSLGTVIWFDVFLSTLSGALNMEWTVKPLSNKYSAIPDEASERAIFPWDLIFAEMV